MAVEADAAQLAEQQRSHWNSYAERWALIGPPLRPGAADIEYLRESVQRLLDARSSPRGRALLLGVTPEIAAIEWDPPLDLLAIDKSVGMVQAVWPGDSGTRRARVGDWLELDRSEAPFDLVVGDGVFSLFDYPKGYGRLSQALSALTATNGLLSLRSFCRPALPESLAQVRAALELGTIGNFNVFKWRLLMALQGDSTRGIRLAEAYRAFERTFGGVCALAAQTGWPEREVGSIEGYRGVDDCYSFPTEQEVIVALAEAFEHLETWRPAYELGERCPHLSFRRRQ
jgi:hypothetical protein